MFRGTKKSAEDFFPTFACWQTQPTIQFRDTVSPSPSVVKPNFQMVLTRNLSQIIDSKGVLQIVQASSCRRLAA
jgi:hypothetical protein